MNERLSQLGQQLLGIWKQLGLNQRISVVMAAGVVVAGLAALAVWSSRVDYALLYGKLDAREAGKVVSALEAAKVPYKVERGGSAIYVPADKVYAMRMQLASQGIPQGQGVGFEIFDKPNFGISDFVQHADFVRAVQGELARTIMQLDQVEAARVMVVMPENRLLIDNGKHPTASVFVKVRGPGSLPGSAVSAIQFLVANAVEGLKTQDVSVVDNHGNVLSNSQGPDSIAGLTTSQLAARRELEKYLSHKAESMLDKVLGPGKAVVQVAADIDFDTVNRTEEKYDPDGQVVRTSTMNDETTSTVGGGSTGGVVGEAVNSQPGTNETTSTTPTTTTHKKELDTEYQISRTTSNTIQYAGSIRRLSAAVFIAAQMKGTGANRKMVPRSTEELKKLQQIVQSALGIQTTGSGTRHDEITLEEIPFNQTPETELSQQLDLQERWQFWLRLLKNALYPGLALAIVALFWRAYRRAPEASIPIGIPLGQMQAMGNGHGNGHGNGNGHNGHGNGHAKSPWGGAPEGDGLSVEILNQLVRENPENMTQAIRSWMSRGKSPNR